MGPFIAMTCHDQFCGWPGPSAQCRCRSSRGTARGCLGRSFKDLWLVEALEHIFNWRMSWEWRAVQLQFRSPDEQWAVAFWHRHAYTGCRHDGTVSTSQSQTRSFVKTSTATSCQRWCQNLDSWGIAGWFYCVDDLVKVTDMVDGTSGYDNHVANERRRMLWSSMVNGTAMGREDTSQRCWIPSRDESTIGSISRHGGPYKRSKSEELSSFSCLDWPGKSGK